MQGIRRHYDASAASSRSARDAGDALLPSRVHAIVLVSKLHKPTLRALAYARATRPSTLEAVTVDVDAGRDRSALQRRVGRAAGSRCR